MMQVTAWLSAYLHTQAPAADSVQPSESQADLRRWRAGLEAEEDMAHYRERHYRELNMLRLF